VRTEMAKQLRLLPMTAGELLSARLEPSQNTRCKDADVKMSLKRLKNSGLRRDHTSNLYLHGSCRHHTTAPPLHISNAIIVWTFVSGACHHSSHWHHFTQQHQDNLCAARCLTIAKARQGFAASASPHGFLGGVMASDGVGSETASEYRKDFVCAL
jgi:hypothetical protein